MLTINAQILPKQIDFMLAVEREVGYSGAFGAGKSRALCFKLIKRASTPGAVELLIRKNNSALRRTTLRTLLEPDGDLPPVLPPGSYIHNKSLQVINIYGGGVIMYFGIDDPAKIGSTPATGCAIDEATELSEADYRALRGRIRVRVAGLPNQLYWATNPGAPSHHLAQRFGLAKGTVATYNCRAITTCSADNFFLPSDYLADLNTFTGVAKSRFVDGLWVAAEGLVYPGLMDCIIPHEDAPPGLGAGGIDFGFTAAFCALGATIYEAEDGLPVCYVHTERYLPRTEIEDHANALRAAWPFNDIIWAADPEDPEAIRHLQQAGLRVVKALNGIKTGIGTVNGIISSGRFFLSEQCENTIKEAEVFSYPQDGKRPDNEKPIGGFDHAMAALRYMVMLIKHRRMMSWVAQNQDGD